MEKARKQDKSVSLPQLIVPTCSWLPSPVFELKSLHYGAIRLATDAENNPAHRNSYYAPSTYSRTSACLVNNCNMDMARTAYFGVVSMFLQHFPSLLYTLVTAESIRGRKGGADTAK